MKRSEVEIGGVYVAKVSGRLVKVKITRDRGERTEVRILLPFTDGSYSRRHPHDGWDALNLDTGRTIHVRTAARLRRKVDEPTNR